MFFFFSNIYSINPPRSSVVVNSPSSQRRTGQMDGDRPTVARVRVYVVRMVLKRVVFAKAFVRCVLAFACSTTITLTSRFNWNRRNITINTPHVFNVRAQPCAVAVHPKSAGNGSPAPARAGRTPRVTIVVVTFVPETHTNIRRRLV